MHRGHARAASVHRVTACALCAPGLDHQERFDLVLPEPQAEDSEEQRKARGYLYGATAELFWDEWAFRIGHMLPPRKPNQLEMGLRFWKYLGDQIEIEHNHTLFGQSVALRLVGYRNHVNGGRCPG